MWLRHLHLSRQTLHKAAAAPQLAVGSDTFSG